MRSGDALMPARALPNRLLLGPCLVRGLEGGLVGLADEEDAVEGVDDSDVDRPPIRDARSLAAVLGCESGAGA